MSDPLVTLGAAERPLRWVELAPDHRCNHRCLGCPTEEHGPSLGAGAMVRALEDARRRGASSLWIGGGEPTLRKDLLPLVRDARARGFSRVKVQTNGAMLAYPDAARRLADAGATEIALSIRGPDAETHDRFSRTAGAFDLLIRAIDNLRSLALPLEGDVLLYRSTTSLLPATVESFFRRGVERFRIWQLFPDERDADALAEEPRLAEVAAAVAAALALGLSSHPDHLVSLHSPPCTLGPGSERARFHAPDLDLLVHDASGSSFRLEASAMEGGAFASACAGCTLRPRCLGARAGYLARHGAAELAPASGDRP